MVPRRGLEPPRPCERQHLKLVRLPIPPPGHGASSVWQAAALKGGAARLVNAQPDPAIAPANGKSRRNADVPSSAAAGSSAAMSANTCSRAGVRLRVAQREPAPRLLPPALGPGRPGRLRPGRYPQCRQRARRSMAPMRSINLCGVFKGMRAVHVDGARNVAEAARDAGATALVHVSAIGADPESQSRYGRTKGEGEAAVRAAFPSATIVRPSLVFGPEDGSPTASPRMARCRSLPVIAAKHPLPAGLCPRPRSGDRHGRARSAAHGGKTYEIGGPQVMTMRRAHRAISPITGQTPDLIDAARFRRRR